MYIECVGLQCVSFVAVCCSALQCVPVCCKALQCVTVRCSALQSVPFHGPFLHKHTRAYVQYMHIHTCVHVRTHICTCHSHAYIASRFRSKVLWTHPPSDPPPFAIFHMHHRLFLHALLCSPLTHTNSRHAGGANQIHVVVFVLRIDIDTLRDRFRDFLRQLLYTNRVRIYIYMYIYICIFMYLYISIHKYVCMYLYIYENKYVHLSICLSIYLYIYIYTHTNILIHIYLHIHTNAA